MHVVDFSLFYEIAKVTADTLLIHRMTPNYGQLKNNK